MHKISYITLLTLVLAGCAHGKMGVVDVPLEKGAIAKGSTIYIEPINADQIQFSGDKSEDQTRIGEEKALITARFHRMIAEELRKKGYKAQTTEQRQSSGIVLSGKVTRFDHG